MTSVVDEFLKCLGNVSFARAGWDVREMAPAQKQSEAGMASNGLARARQIWAENIDLHDELRAAFVKFQPLMEMREIERA